MSEQAERLPPFDKSSESVLAYVDFSIGWILVCFTMFLFINGSDRPVANAAAGTTVIFVGHVIVRRLIFRWRR